MDDYRIDAQKIHYHPQRLSRWLEGKDVAPIYLEVSPVGSCNHRCIFCALDYLGYKPTLLRTAALKRFIADSAALGVKSMMFAGEGEPLLHKDIVELVTFTKSKGIDVALTTNGVLLNRQNLPALLSNLSWLRISLNAGTARNYSRIHRTHPGDFLKVIANLKAAVALKRRTKSTCTIGAQFLLLPQNQTDAATTAGLCRRIGLDYLIIKPYSQHPFSQNRLSRTINYAQLLKLEKRLDRFSGKGFRLIFRRQAMEKFIHQRPYQCCYGISFWAYLNSQGDVYACSAFLGDKRFCLGNIYRQRFRQIWQGSKRRALLKMMRTWDSGRCRRACRMDEVNRFLWDLKHPPPHVNFI